MQFDIRTYERTILRTSLEFPVTFIRDQSLLQQDHQNPENDYECAESFFGKDGTRERFADE